MRSRQNLTPKPTGSTLPLVLLEQTLPLVSLLKGPPSRWSCQLFCPPEAGPAAQGHAGAGSQGCQSHQGTQNPRGLGGSQLLKQGDSLRGRRGLTPTSRDARGFTGNILTPKALRQCLVGVETHPRRRAGAPGLERGSSESDQAQLPYGSPPTQSIGSWTESHRHPTPTGEGPRRRVTSSWPAPLPGQCPVHREPHSLHLVTLDIRGDAHQPTRSEPSSSGDSSSQGPASLLSNPSSQTILFRGKHHD